MDHLPTAHITLRNRWPKNQVGHMLFVPDIFALKRTNGIEEISRYSNFDR